MHSARSCRTLARHCTASTVPGRGPNAAGDGSAIAGEDSIDVVRASIRMRFMTASRIQADHRLSGARPLMSALGQNRSLGHVRSAPKADIAVKRLSCGPCLPDGCWWFILDTNSANGELRRGCWFALHFARMKPITQSRANAGSYCGNLSKITEEAQPLIQYHPPDQPAWRIARELWPRSEVPSRKGHYFATVGVLDSSDE
jgi:hypothetical protein